MADLKWSSDGQEMFDKIMVIVPEAMRDAVKPMLFGFIEKRAAGKPVTADIVSAMVQNDLPEPQRTGIMQALGMKKPAEQAAPEAASAPAAPPPPPFNPQWQGKSETMFEQMLQEVPEALRGVFRGKLMEILRQKSKGGAVAETYVTEIVQEIVPEPFKSKILKKFSEMGDFDISVIDTIIARHGVSQDNLTYILHDTQEAIGYLPPEALRAISNKTGIYLSTIYNVATFYKAFRLEPKGEHHIKVCNGTACHLKDRDGVVPEIEQLVGGASAKKVTLEKTLCLGCCDCAPTVIIDGEVSHGTEAKKKVKHLLT
jgi:NADH:ubiquinone oxidoreductase subunit E